MKLRRADRQQYDAFLSYAQASDEEIAAAMRQVLQSIAKPWWKLRSFKCVS